MSRSGRFPAAHRPGVQALALDSADVDGIRTLDDVLRYFREQDRAGHDWRAAIDGLRPHTQRLWQRLPPSDQKAAIARWSSVWGVRRHRMAVEVAERIDLELRSGALSLLPTAQVIPRATTNGLALELQARDGCRATLRPSAVVD